VVSDKFSNPHLELLSRQSPLLNTIFALTDNASVGENRLFQDNIVGIFYSQRAK